MELWLWAVVASERITTTEEWSEIPDTVLFTVGRETGLEIFARDPS